MTCKKEAEAFMTEDHPTIHLPLVVKTPRTAWTRAHAWVGFNKEAAVLDFGQESFDEIRRRALTAIIETL